MVMIEQLAERTRVRRWFQFLAAKSEKQDLIEQVKQAARVAAAMKSANLTEHRAVAIVAPPPAYITPAERNILAVMNGEPLKRGEIVRRLNRMGVRIGPNHVSHLCARLVAKGILAADNIGLKRQQFAFRKCVTA